VKPKHASWTLREILCADAQTLYVTFNSAEQIFQVPLRLAVTLPQFQVALPFFLHNFVSVQAYEQHVRKLVSNRDCFAFAGVENGDPRPVESQVWHSRALAEKAVAVFENYQKWDQATQENITPRRALAVKLATLLEADFPASSSRKPKRKVSWSVDESVDETDDEKHQEEHQEEDERERRPMLEDMQQELKRVKFLAQRCADKVLKVEAELSETRLSRPVPVPVPLFEHPLFDESVAATRSLITRMQESLNVRNAGNDDEQNDEQNDDEDNARAYDSQEFKAAVEREVQAMFGARLEQALPQSQVFQNLDDRLRASALKTLELRQKFDEQTARLRSEWVIARHNFHERLSEVENKSALAALPLPVALPLAPSCRYVQSF
jgi:hypothetical protein